MEHVKPCIKCGATERYGDGECAPCARVSNRAWLAANPAKVNARRRAYSAANPAKVNARMRAWCAANPVQVMLTSARKRARRKGLEFTLQVGDVAIPSHCPVLGVPLVRGTEHAPSLDRVDTSLGYTPGNVLVVSNRVNKLKGDASLDELRAIAGFYATWGKGPTS